MTILSRQELLNQATMYWFREQGLTQTDTDEDGVMWCMTPDTSGTSNTYQLSTNLWNHRSAYCLTEKTTDILFEIIKQYKISLQYGIVAERWFAYASPLTQGITASDEDPNMAILTCYVKLKDKQYEAQR